MRYFFYLTAFLLAALLASCGGGGGSPGISSGPNPTFSVVAPTVLTLQVGLTQQYKITGGVKPYTVFSTDPAVAVGWLVGEDVFAVGTTAPGKATVSVLDAKGSKFEMVLTAGSSLAFFTSAPTVLNISPGVPQTFVLGGGVAPYSATTNFPSVATAKVVGNNLIITGVRIDNLNAATITVRDAAGAVLTSVVSVKTTKLEMFPGSGDTATVFLGDTLNLLIIGGTPPYRVLEPIDGVFDAKIVNGNQVQMIGNRIAEGVQINVVDADNQSVAGPKVKIVAGQDSLRISPAAFTILENANSQNIVLNVFGVAAGSPIQVFSSNSKLFVPGTPVKVNATGTAYTITLTGGNTCMNGVGVDNTNPPNGTFTDKAGVPNLTVQPLDDIPPVTTIPITITVLDASGRQGTSTITVKDNGLGGTGC